MDEGLKSFYQIQASWYAHARTGKECICIECDGTGMAHRVEIHEGRVEHIEDNCPACGGTGHL